MTLPQRGDDYPTKVISTTHSSTLCYKAKQNNNLIHHLFCLIISQLRNLVSIKKKNENEKKNDVFINILNYSQT